MHLLVVDDDPGVRGILLDLLTLSGHTASEAAGGSEALALLQTEQFDAILLDHLMPEMTGIELFEKLRALGTDVPVGFITGSRGNPDIVRLESQAVPVLFKPFPSTEFRALLKRLQALHLGVSSE
jgi:CheY-like chemotaxis protein